MSQAPVGFDATGFEFQGEHDGVLVWATPEGDAVGLFHYPIPPDIGVDLRDVESIRAFYRGAANEAGLGVVEIETVMVDGCLGVRTLFKAAQEPSGRAYLGAVTLPFRDFSYVLKVQCEERGMTGMRDTAVSMALMQSGETAFDPESGVMTGWRDDPYDPTEAGPMTRNRSERPEYDADFPDHPLSRARRVLDHLARTTTIDEAVKRRAAFGEGAGGALLQPGSTLDGQYEIVGRVRGDRMRSVYAAHDLRLRRQVEIHEWVGLFDGRRPWTEADFAREATALSETENRSIPAPVGYFVRGDRCYLITSPAVEKTIAEFAAQTGGRVSDLTAFGWARHICRALEGFHAASPPIVHGAVEPSRMGFAAGSAQLVFVDYGIARIAGQAEPVASSPFRAPEIADRAADPRSDVYGVGATYFSLLTGYEYTRGMRVSHLYPQVAPDVDEIVAKATAYDPEDRYPSAREMTAALEAYNRRLPMPG